MDVLVRYTRCLTPHNASDADDDVTSFQDRNSRLNLEAVQCLNDEKAFLYFPVIVFLGLLVVVGTLGNILVLCVYWRKSYKASSHYFILTLAALDLFSCLVGLPTEIADLRYPYLFDLPIACKLLRFTHSSTIIASSTILIQVAFDRYYRICKLGQQFSVHKAKMLCLMSVILGVLTSWPTCLIFGRKTLNLYLQRSRTVVRMRPAPEAGTGSSRLERDGEESPPMAISLEGDSTSGVNNGDAGLVSVVPELVLLQGSDCSTEDSMRGTVYPTIYYLFLFSLFFITVAFFAVLYTRIGVAIWRRKRKTIGSKLVFTKVNSNGSDHTSTEMSSETDGPDPGPHLKHGPRSQQQQQQQQKLSSPDCRHCPTARHLPLSHHHHHHHHHPPPKAHVPTLTPDLKSALPVLQFSHPYPLPHLSTTYLSGTLGRGEKQHKGKDGEVSRSIVTTTPVGLHSGGTLPRSNKCQTGVKDIAYPQPPTAYLTGTLTRKDKAGKSKEAEAEGTHLHLQPNCGAGKRREIRVGKTTTVLFAVTLAYILSFLPYLVVMVLRSTIKDFEGRLSPVGEVAYKFCVKSFFINNAINPLIYSFLNAGFRKDASKTLRQLWHQCFCSFVCCCCWCCCRSAASRRRSSSSSYHDDGPCGCSGAAAASGGGGGGGGGGGIDSCHDCQGCCCCGCCEDEDDASPTQSPGAV